MKLVVVESPNKVHSIQKYLGDEYQVIASVGHIRDIERLKNNDIGVDFDTWEANYQVPPKKKGAAQRIVRAAAKASAIFLCADADREGEAIAWHVAQLIGAAKKKAKRAKFTEITQKAVEAAIQNPVEIDYALVEAQQTRRIIDRIVGFQASAVLNRALGKGQATGRVQAATLFIVCRRQREIIAHVPVEYYVVQCAYPEGFVASYFVEEEKSAEKVAEEDGESGESASESSGGRIFVRAAAEEIVQAARSEKHFVHSVLRREAEVKPKPPFTTSSMQQVATVAFGRSGKEIMAAAQRLFEGGLITYHRTDSQAVDDDFQKATLAWLRELEGEASRVVGAPIRLCPEAPRVYKQKANVQGAHECIRPTDLGRLPTNDGTLDDALYSCIFYHYLASQAANATDSVTTLVTRAGPHKFRAVERRQVQPGFRWLLARANEGKPPREVAELPRVAQGQQLGAPKVELKEEKTKPPPLLREADLIRIMEKEGVGRPSTYTQTVEALLFRGYVAHTKQKRLYVTQAGERALIYMEEHMPELPHVAYTAEIERQLDEVAESKTTRKRVLGDWYEIWQNTMANAVEALRAGVGARVEERAT